MCGPGGDLFALVWDPQHGLAGLNASGAAPRGQDLAMLRARLGDAAQIPLHGPASVTVPGAVRGWAALHQRWGRLSVADVLAPVIAYAGEGVVVGPNTAGGWRHAVELVRDSGIGGAAANLFATFTRDGATPASGARVVNPDLARTYGLLADEGWDGFYHGTLATRLAAYLATAGSAIDADDLARSSAEWVTPLETSYRGVTVHELPPNGQGLTVLQMLNLIEHHPVADWGPDSPRWWHLFVEAKKLAFEDRARYYADPAWAEVPVAALLDKRYGAERTALIGERANPAPRPGDPSLARGDTTYLAVADGDGLMVSLIQSVYSGFGSGLVPDGLGFPLQCRGAGFNLDPAHPNVYAPGKRPFHTIIPAFVTRDGAPLMGLGVMGADMQPQGQVQVLVNMLDFGLEPQAAGDRPRMRHDGINHPNRSRPADAGVVLHEAGFAPALLADLAGRGHDVRPATHPQQHFMGGYQCIRREADGTCTGASECRFDGAVVAA